MHPIERLRYVARAGAVDPVDLAAEAARALGAFDGDPVGLVAAARRLVARHPTAGPLWWTCNRVLVAAEPMAEARRAAAELTDDPTSDAAGGGPARRGPRAGRRVAVDGAARAGPPG